MKYEHNVSRDISRYANLYEFCDKHHLSKEYGNDLEELTQDALLTMTLQNEFRRPTDSDHYQKIRVEFDGHPITVGYFTPNEIEDIKLLNHVKVVLI